MGGGIEPEVPEERRRASLETGEFVGQRKLSVTSDTYTHVLSDGREVDLAALLAEREGLRDGGEGWNFWIRGTSKSV